MRGEFPRAPTTASTAYLYLFPCNLPSLLGEFSMFLSKAKTSICAQGTISSHPLKDVTPARSFLSCIITFFLHTGSFSPTQRTRCNTSYFKRQKNLTPLPSFNHYLMSFLAFIDISLKNKQTKIEYVLQTSTRTRWFWIQRKN